VATEDARYWLGFNRVRGIGPVRLRALLDYFSDIATAWEADAPALRSAGLDQRSVNNLLTARARLDLDKEVEQVDRLGAHILTWADDSYPRQLRQIHSSPPVLYVLGKIVPEDEWALAVVGTRRASVYGLEATRFLVQGLAHVRITVVSGLARGIDAQAHQSALDAGGRTIAVLGSGIDIIYPAEHRPLAEKIVQNGALLTEYPPGTRPEAGNFPPRNRIISGLALGALIVEAGIGSGAMITADYAAEQGREVFAVPGNIFNRGSEGTNRLIRDGAKMVLSVEDILEELNFTVISQQAEARALIPANEVESQLLSHLSSEPVHVDELKLLSGLSIETISGTLTLMELKGMVRRVSGMNYVLAREGCIEYQID
jgi:DNA processing protein